MSKNHSFALSVQEEICTGCGLCAENCIYGAIQMHEYPEIDPYACRLCGNCVSQCPSEALILQKPEKKETNRHHPQTRGIWVFAEVEGQALATVTKELTGKATELSGKLRQPVEAVLIGEKVGRFSSELISYGADHVHIIENPCFASFTEEDYAHVLHLLFEKYHPEILLVGATNRGRGMSARLAAMLRTGLTADCTDLDIDPSTLLLLQVRPAFGGNLIATIITPDRRPQIASVRPGVMKMPDPDPARRGEVVIHDFSTFRRESRIRIIRETPTTGKKISLNDCRIIIGIGRGVKKEKYVVRLKQWAASIGAIVAGSRAAVEDGHIEAEMQIGQTGHTIAPELYIAIGISGQIQHTAAIRGARHIIAINPDRTAPIFQIADYGWNISVEKFLSLI